ncbi:hypothetical protein BTO20_19600 [Mycobacterium dioxanotrophicus]|uniref:Uncharacterized protein n=1 Tax=Mycobacterium dioxanotrophicus TaxID=482462 RepID=A0A1Y0C5K0_9MYCO|nr:hypothetical protein [Mycobacterium dioxanotrophicus]ART70479.1 hypothetical protein BTO20_19600 [Mycobacterium dioxanotrophicus]
MAVLHTPETRGAKALYYDAGGSSIERDIIGWDKLGRPLVLCGDRLHTADGAPFAHYKEFRTVVMPDVLSIIRESIDRCLDDYKLGRVYDPIYDAVKGELARRRPRALELDYGEGILKEHFGMPLLIHVQEPNVRMSHYGNQVTGTPLVNYLALDPITESIQVVRNATITQRAVATVVVRTYRRGPVGVIGVALISPDTDSPVLKALSSGTGYSVHEAAQTLTDSAVERGWLPAPETSAGHRGVVPAGLHEVRRGDVPDR